PVSTFANVGLLAPDLRRRGWQVAIPIVETQVDAAEELQKSRAGAVTQKRHRGNRREADHAIRAVLLDGMDRRGRDQLKHLLPVAAPEATFAARPLITLSRFFVRDD